MGSRFYSKRLRVKAERKAARELRAKRPKSFKSEEAAKKWAEAKKISDYSLRNLKGAHCRVKKIIVVRK